jgi:TonB family protein
MTVSKYFSFSLLLHGVLLVWIIIQSVSINRTTVPFIPAYSYHSSISEKNNLSQKKIIPDKTGFQHEFNTKKNIPIKIQQPSKSEINQEISHRVLLKILHDAIATTQHYPDKAIELNEKGIVTLGFILNPSGSIENLRIVKSSGFDEMDASAIQALQAISPIKNIREYLQNQENFTIDVIFQ